MPAMNNVASVRAQRSWKGGVSLRLQINLIIAVMMTLFIGTLVYQQIEDTRSSVREEIEGSNRCRHPAADRGFAACTRNPGCAAC